MAEQPENARCACFRIECAVAMETSAPLAMLDRYFPLPGASLSNRNRYSDIQKNSIDLEGKPLVVPNTFFLEFS